MEFKRDIDQLFVINKKAHAVIVSCKNYQQLEAAKRYVTLVNRFYETIECTNQIQIDYITPHLNDLISFLRQELKNYDISVEFLLIEDNDSTVKFLSGKDRFAAMARKNANLHTLKKVFNLDIEF